MGDLFADGESLIADMSAEHLSEPIVYARGSASFTTNATIGSRTFERDNADGSVVTFQTRDFIFKAGDFDLDEDDPNDEIPKEGDTITDANGSVYRVLPEAGSDFWKYTDPARTSIRVSTKRVSR